MGKRTWTNDDVRILREYYPEFGAKKCAELILNKTKRQIKDKAGALGIKSNHYKKWSDEENEKLKIAWRTCNMEDLLLSFPGRTYQEILLHANKLGYHTNTDRKRKCDLTFLDLDSLTKESSYWWGFIMADGHLSKRGQLVIQLKDIDKEHLVKFASHVKGNVKQPDNGFVRLACNDIRKMSVWKKKLGMVETAKTYFPPDLSVFEGYFVYFFIGFVDGDGCIWLSRGYPQIKVEVHLSWLKNIEWFSKMLKERYGIESANVHISKKQTVVLSIGNRSDVLKLFEYSKEVESLSRKWDRLSDRYSV